MEYITKKQIINTNCYQVDTFGGNFVPLHNFLHEENLDYLLEAVQAEMFGEPLYPEVYHKAGLYMFNVICNHIFQDGNKRTGLEASLLFLQLNGSRRAMGFHCAKRPFDVWLTTEYGLLTNNKQTDIFLDMLLFYVGPILYFYTCDN